MTASRPGPAILALLAIPFGAGCAQPQSLSLSMRDPDLPASRARDDAAGARTAGAEDPVQREGDAQQPTANGPGRRDPHLPRYAALAEGDNDPTVRGAAVRMLGEAGQVTYLPQIVKALSDASITVRWDASAALDQVVGEAAVEPLQAHATTDSSQDVRAGCVKALRHYPRPEVIRTLRQCLADPAGEVQDQARSVLASLRPEGGAAAAEAPAREPEGPSEAGQAGKAHPAPTPAPGAQDEQTPPPDPDTGPALPTGLPMVEVTDAPPQLPINPAEYE